MKRGKQIGEPTENKNGIYISSLTNAKNILSLIISYGQNR